MAGMTEDAELGVAGLRLAGEGESSLDGQPLPHSSRFFTRVGLPDHLMFQEKKRIPIFKKKKMYLFIYFWLYWVFVAARGLSLVAERGGYPSLRCAGFSLRWFLFVVEHGL